MKPCCFWPARSATAYACILGPLLTLQLHVCVCVSFLLLLQENLKLSPAMLSRFDVIFVLLDRPDELMDQALSEHIMALHSGKLKHCRRSSCTQRLHTHVPVDMASSRRSV